MLIFIIIWCLTGLWSSIISIFDNVQNRYYGNDYVQWIYEDFNHIKYIEFLCVFIYFLLAAILGPIWTFLAFCNLIVHEEFIV